jgi:hypothetical protein
MAMDDESLNDFEGTGHPQLIGGGISADDSVWNAKIDFKDIKTFFQDPVKWVDGLNDQLSAEDRAQRKINLNKHFLITFKSPKKSGSIGESHLLVQGINGSGIVVIRPQMSLFPTDFRDFFLPEDLVDLADEALDMDGFHQKANRGNPDINVEVTLCEEFNLVFTHYQITAKGDSPKVRGAKIAAHIFSLCSPGGLSDLTKKWKISGSRRFKGPQNVEDTTRPVRHLEVDKAFDPNGILFVYEGSPQSNVVVCSKIVGTLDPYGMLVPETVTILNYPPGKDGLSSTNTDL